MQPGQTLTLFNGGLLGGQTVGGEFEATILRMGRSEVEVEVGTHRAIEREASTAVHLAIGMPTNERMDWLIEKATELGAASVQPLLTERSILRLKGERADKKTAHWRGVAIAACEQCGRNRLPDIHEVCSLHDWLQRALPTKRWLLSLQDNSQPLAKPSDLQSLVLLCGPEGGLTMAEEQAALERQFVPTRLGPRVLRSETAPLAALAALTLT